MLRYKLPDGRCSALRLPAALILAMVAAAPAAHADLSHLSRDTVATAEGDMLEIEQHPGKVGGMLAGRLMVPDWQSLLAPAGVSLDGQSPVSLWLSQAWPLGLAVRPAPAAMLTLWLTGGVHQVLSWIAQPGVEPGDQPGDQDDLDVEAGLEVIVDGVDGVDAAEAALGRALDLIEVEPVTGAETSSYGYRSDPFTNRRKFHKGVDYRAPRGTPVFAAGPGVVKVARRKSGYGRVIMIDHGAGVETRYAHLQRMDVDAGERVSAGMRIGTVGSTGRATGPHLHFELRIDGEAHDPQEVLGPLAPAELVSRGF